MRPNPNPPHRLYAAIAGLLLGAMLLGREVVSLRAALAAKPRVVDRVVYKRVQGPSRVELRTITKPGGETMVEKIRYVDRVEIEQENAHKEMSAALPPAAPRGRYVGVGVDPLNYARPPRLRAGMTFFRAVDLGVTYDSRFAPTRGAFGIEASYRF